MIIAHDRDELQTPTIEVTKDLWPSPELIQEILQTAWDNKLEYLAANQIGCVLNFFVGKIDGTWHVFINPEIAIATADSMLVYDYCPHTQMPIVVKRTRRCMLEWTGIDGSMNFGKFTGATAAQLESAVRYLNGMPIMNREKLGDWGG